MHAYAYFVTKKWLKCRGHFSVCIFQFHSCQNSISNFIGIHISSLRLKSIKECCECYRNCVQYRELIFLALVYTLTWEAVFVNPITASHYITELIVRYQVRHSQYCWKRKRKKQKPVFFCSWLIHLRCRVPLNKQNLMFVQYLSV